MKKILSGIFLKDFYNHIFNLAEMMINYTMYLYRGYFDVNVALYAPQCYLRSIKYVMGLSSKVNLLFMP